MNKMLKVMIQGFEIAKGKKIPPGQKVLMRRLVEITKQGTSEGT